MNETSPYAERIVAGLKQAPQGRYYPTLVLGLGGTGLRVLRNLKKRLAAADVNQVRLFGIDSDNSENEKYPELPPLSQSEMAILNAEMAVRSLERAAAGHTTDAHVLRFLPNQHGDFKGLHQEVRARITSQKGAGQLRRAGKLLFCANVSGGANLNARFSGIRTQLTGISTTVARIRDGLDVDPGVKVYVVGSIAGGTGAGCLLDCLALLRKHFNTEHDIITAILVLPGPLLDQVAYDPLTEKAQMRGNALGVLRELQPFLVGGMEKHPFVFDQHNVFELGTSMLVNDVYLVDHYTHDGRLAKDKEDLYRGVGHFLYALVGSGVGASQVAGQVNGNVTIDHKNQTTPLVYNAFGVASVEFPNDALSDYAVRATLKGGLDQWLGQKPDVENDQSEADNFLTAAGLRDLEDLLAALLPAMDAATLTEGWRRAVLQEPDEQFIGRTVRRREGLEEELKDQQMIIDQATVTFVEGMNPKVEAKVLEWVAKGQGTVRTGLTYLRKHLESLATARREEAESREGTLASLKNRLQKKERWVNILDMGTDTKVRKEYLDLTQKIMQATVAKHLDPNVAEALAKMLAKVAELETAFANLANEVRAFHAYNRETLRKIEASSPVSCFIQEVLSPGQYSAWLKENEIPATACNRPSALTLRALVEAMLEPVVPSYRRVIEALDLTNVARRDKGVRNAVVATNAASEPLMHLVPTAPDRQNMVPQKFVAGPFQNAADPFIAEHFTPVNARTVEGLPTGDKHRLICIQTISGFAAIHWKGFDVAEAYYQAKPWRYHTVASPDDLPPLRPVSKDLGVALRHFGLGLVFDLITNRGAKYYQNFVFYGPDKVHYYLLYVADPGPGAAKLLAVQPALIKPADRDKTKALKQYLLGDSLEEAFESFRTPQSAPFVQLLDDLVEAFIARAGKVEMRALVEAYVTGQLVPLIEAAVEGSARRKILEDVRDTLKTYASQSI